MLRIGLIGCGQITKVRHAPEYMENANCELAALYDSDSARANAIASQYGGKVCGTVEELLQSGLDAVSICVANTAHCAYTVQALEAGLHVLCEKPMATTLEDCQRMVEAAGCRQKILMIGQNQRYNQSHQRAREMLAAGVIGRLIGFRLTFGHSGPEGWTGTANPWFYSREKASFGALADLGIHKIDLLRYLSGEEIVEVTAALGTVDKKYPDGSPIDVDDNALFIFRLAGGALGTVCASWTFYGGEDNSTTLYGTEGSIQIFDDPKYSIIVKKQNGERQFLQLDEMTTNAKQFHGERISTGVIDAFVEAIETGLPPLASGEEVLKSMKAVFAANRAVKERRTLAVE